jgi:hypothetical protein
LIENGENLAEKLILTEQKPIHFQKIELR